MCLGSAGKVVEIVDLQHDLVRVDIDGRLQDVSVAMLTDGPVSVGDWVLVHMGFAMERTDEEEAAVTRRMVQDLVEAYDDSLRASVEKPLQESPSSTDAPAAREGRTHGD